MNQAYIAMTELIRLPYALLCEHCTAFPPPLKDEYTPILQPDNGLIYRPYALLHEYRNFPLEG